MSCCEQSSGLVKSSVLLLSGVILALSTLTACTFPKPDGGIPQECEVDEDCTARPGTLVCDLPSGMGVCVQCTTARAEACTGMTPACGATNLCEACDSHSDCASDACLPTGSCAAEAEVVYLKQGGSGAGGGNCTKDAPCGLLETAIVQAMMARPYIRVIGTITNALADIGDKKVVFLGEKAPAGSALRGGDPAGDPAILTLRINAQVELHNIMLSDSDGPGVRVDGAGSTLLLSHSKIESADEEGILISNGVVTVSDSEVSTCGSTGSGARRGINLALGELTVNRSKISENGGGGLLVAQDQKFVITHSFIVGNRLNGGLSAITPGAGSKFEFNTVADNRDEVGNGQSDAGGVFCDDSTFTLSNNIIFRNLGGNNGSGFVQTSGNCTYSGSLISSNAQAETSSLGLLKDTAPRDYHLTAASPATVRDVASVVCTGLKDIDGDGRPQGAACDLGADEFRVQ